MTDSLLSAEQRVQIEELIANAPSGSLLRRAQVLLLYDDGLPTREVAGFVGISRRGCRYWRSRFYNEGMTIFDDTFVTSIIEIVEEGQEDLETPAQKEKSEEPPLPEKLSLAEFSTAAKKLKGPGVEPDDPLAEAGRKVLRYHFAQMLLHEDGTRLGEDIEELHDMRVATRRMRAAFEVFGAAYKSKTIQPHLKGLRATGRALGRVRDLDVFMEKAQKYLESLPEEQHGGLGPLLQSWQRERETARSEMITYLDSAAYKSFKDSFYEFLATPGAGAVPIPQDVFTPHLVRETAPVLIYTCLASVRSFDSVLESASIEQLHALRIEFKKLRYTAEFFREVLGEQAKAVIDDIKSIQDHLGDLNDAQVATEILREFLSQWDQEQARLSVLERQSPEPIMDYLSYRYVERHQLMVTFREVWIHFNRPEFRQNLALAVSVL